jgi:hypothetical protein
VCLRVSVCLHQHLNFRDRSFDAPASKPLFVQVFCIVSLYWIAPYMLMRYRKDEVVPAWELCSVLSLYTVGMFLHYVSGTQDKKDGSNVYPGNIGNMNNVCGFRCEEHFCRSDLRYCRLCLCPQIARSSTSCRREAGGSSLTVSSPLSATLTTLVRT